MNGQVSIEVAAGLTLAAKAVTTGNVAATVEPRAIRLWLMAAPLLVSAPERGGKRLEQGAQVRVFSAPEQASSGLHSGRAAPSLRATRKLSWSGVRECARTLALRAERCTVRKTCKPFTLLATTHKIRLPQRTSLYVYL